jgi:hypothetical protein
MCGLHAVANAVRAYFRPSRPCCDQRARGHSKHDNGVLDGGLYRVIWNGNFCPSYLDLFLLLHTFAARLRAGPELDSDSPAAGVDIDYHFDAPIFSRSTPV